MSYIFYIFFNLIYARQIRLRGQLEAWYIHIEVQSITSYDHIYVAVPHQLSDVWRICIIRVGLPRKSCVRVSSIRAHRQIRWTSCEACLVQRFARIRFTCAESSQELCLASSWSWWKDEHELLTKSSTHRLICSSWIQSEQVDLGFAESSSFFRCTAHLGSRDLSLFV